MELENSRVCESTFLVRNQKRCNFCGKLLNNPEKFTFAVKCKACALKNTVVILPARFLCNLCIDRNNPYLVESRRDQIPLGHISKSEALQSSELVKQVWTVITETLKMLDQKLSEEDSLPKEKSDFFLSSFNSSHSS
jgi:hypothetical protein